MKPRLCSNCNAENGSDAIRCRLCAALINDDTPTLARGFNNDPISKDERRARGVKTTEMWNGAEDRTTPPETDQSDFGFEEGRVKFLKEGIGNNTAETLAERFRLICPIAEGGMGKIFLAQESLSGRYVALKVMMEKALRDESLVQQFVREAVITARLQHPHIIPVYDLGFLSGNQLYYTMRYIEGTSFNEIIVNAELDERLRVLRSAALAVDYAHSQGLWHRDLKPQNILVGQLGDTYVTDWGLVSIQPDRRYELNLPRIVVERATYVIPDRLLEETDKAVTSATGVIVGTPAYMAPEQCMGENCGAVSDVWAFGIMLFQALTGGHPIENYTSKSAQDILFHIMQEEFPSPKDILENTPSELNDLCLRMLKKKATNRMQNLKEFITHITHYLRSSTTFATSFGTFSKGLDRTTTLSNEAILIPLRQKVNELQSSNQMLLAENKRYKEKITILAEMVQLGILSNKRKKELWTKLASI